MLQNLQVRGAKRGVEKKWRKTPAHKNLQPTTSKSSNTDMQEFVREYAKDKRGAIGKSDQISM
jgi:hypothetical protein